MGVLDPAPRRRPGLALQLAVCLLLVLALRLPFLTQAIQGDDVYYLYGAEHAQIDPLHPTHARYIFQGDEVDMRGHPHPPLDSWVLGALLAVVGDIREVPFHAAYIGFSLIAALSALALARRFTGHALAAICLFLATPAFVVNGNSFEADVPFVAFWLAATALFVYAADRRSMWLLSVSCIAMALAAMTAYQSIVLVPILALYLVYAGIVRWRAAWIALAVIPVVIAGWQLHERLNSGAVPAAVLAGYMNTYDLQAGAQKLRNAVALTGHLGWLVFPVLSLAAFARRWFLPAAAALAAAIYDPNPLFWISIGTGVAVLTWCIAHARDWLAQWILLFFAAALVLFFAGSQRYLLPIALPVALLVSQRVAPKWLYAGFAVELALSIALAVVSYQHWNQYREIARTVASEAQNHRVWMDGEWGLRYYLESDGALPMLRGQAVHAGDIVVTSDLAYPVPFTTGAAQQVPEREWTVTSPVPLRMIALHTKSAYSTTMDGLRPFDISNGAIDRVRMIRISERKPALSYVAMNAPQAPSQIVSGIYNLEGNDWRWASRRAVLFLKAPPAPQPVRIDLNIPDKSPVRRITVILENQIIAERTFTQPGTYQITTPPVSARSSAPVLAILADTSFSVPGDARDLAYILQGAGFAGNAQR